MFRGIKSYFNANIIGEENITKSLHKWINIDFN